MSDLKSNIFNDFLQLQQVENSIKNLNNYIWPVYNNSIDFEQFTKDIYEVFFQYFGIYPPSPMILVNAENEVSLKFYRVRPLEDFTDLSLITEYSYPPINNVVHRRCNFPKKPVFYSSNNPYTSIKEVVRESETNNETIYLLSAWEINKKCSIRVVPYLFQNLPLENEYKKLGAHALEEFKRVLEKEKQLNESQINGCKLYLQFLASKFIEDNHNISAALAHSILYANINLRADIFIYPSIMTDLKTVNMAIHPNFVDQNMELKRIYSIKVKKTDDKFLIGEISIRNYAEVKDGVIIWRNSDVNDKDFWEFSKDDFHRDTSNTKL
ncbi:MAG: hypothetical protein ACOYMD_12690 [Paludibacter sp.]